MRKLLLPLVGPLIGPLVGLALVCGVTLLSPRVEAAVSASAIHPSASEGGTIEKAACVRRRVCGPRGCGFRTICRRW